MTPDLLPILLAHDRWATRNILDACIPLTDAQFHQRFDIGPGSLHDTLTHILSCIRGWTDDLTARAPLPVLKGTTRTPEQLIQLLDEEYDHFVAATRLGPPDEPITVTFDSGNTRTYTRAVIIAHVITHSMHHRAQCLNMLRHLGVDPLPRDALDDWSLQEQSE